MNSTLGTIFVAALLLAAPAAALSQEPTGVLERVIDAVGRLVFERGIEPSDPTIAYVKHYTHKPNHGGGGGGGGDGGGSNDCASTAYKTNGYFWDQSYSGYASSFASTLDASGRTWDTETGAGIFGGISSGSRGVAGDLDGVNQHDWTDLGSGGTIAVTTTWYYRGSGIAVESDAQYNTYYPWSTSGASGSMDVQNIATHEIGHTFGLGHPNGGGISCLTMYAYADYGETQKRTLGTGDILGIEAIYGP